MAIFYPLVMASHVRYLLDGRFGGYYEHNPQNILLMDLDNAVQGCVLSKAYLSSFNFNFSTLFGEPTLGVPQGY